MRRTLNILQSACMSSNFTNEDSVYARIQSSHPRYIKMILYWLIKASYTDCFMKIAGLQITKNIALVDIVKELHSYVIKLDITNLKRMDLLEALSDVEHRLAYGTNEK